MHTPPTLSLTTVAAITDISERTWWRRIEQGAVRRGGTGPGKQMRLLLADVLPEFSVPVTSEDIEFIMQADAGDADAQNDLGQMFAMADKPKAAIYWWQQAANQGHADAMQWLSQCHAGGEGVPRDENLSMMWLAKAASLGHVIAARQMDGILQRTRSVASARSHTPGLMA